MNRRLAIEVGAATDRGMRRNQNEDSLAGPPGDLPADLLERKGYLFVVADGIGGRKAGKTASDLTVRVVSHQYYADPSPDLGGSLVNAIQLANAEVHRLAQEPAYERMGTTVVAAVLQRDEFYVAHVGDSRAYRVTKNQIQPLTRDHSWVAELVRNGDLTAEQASKHKQHHVLTRSIGRDPQVKVDVSHSTLDPGDQVLLCSDGLWELLADREIQAIMVSLSPQQATQQMIQMANKRGGPDNITALIGKIVVAAEPVAGPPRIGAGQETVEQPILAATRPARKRLLLGAAAVTLLLFGLIMVAALIVLRPPPQSAPPAVKTAPVLYVVVEGDTRQDLMDYFQVSDDTLPEIPPPGRSVQFTPGRYAILFTGQVVSAEQSALSTRLQVDSSSKSYEVVCDIASNAPASRDWPPKQGTTVSVSGFPVGSDRIKATTVDVWQDSERQTWFQSDVGADTWLYSGFHEYLIPAADPGLLGQQILVKGTWSPSGVQRVFDWEDQDLYLLEDGVYTPYLPQAERQPRRASEQPFGPPAADSTAKPSGPVPTATASDPAPQSYTGIVRTDVILKVRSGPSRGAIVLRLLEPGDRIQVRCWTTGESVRDNVKWYRTPLADDQVGYVSAHWIELGGVEPTDVPQCDT
ncbi:Stp1/IreP family PP2C-type Ser/Thr phosphatase [Chloroflexota bacterium]